MPMPGTSRRVAVPLGGFREGCRLAGAILFHGHYQRWTHIAGCPALPFGPKFPALELDLELPIFEKHLLCQVLVVIVFL